MLIYFNHTFSTRVFSYILVNLQLEDHIYTEPLIHKICSLITRNISILFSHIAPRLLAAPLLFFPRLNISHICSPEGRYMLLLYKIYIYIN